MPQIPAPRKRRLPPSRHGRRPKPTPDFTHNPYRWYIADYDQVWVGTTLYVTVTSDVPCHMNLHATNIPTRIHLDEDSDSGYRWLWSPRFCFVESSPIEQNEPGDVLVHTFTFPGWSLYLTRWWIFTATMSGERSISGTCIFRATFLRLDFYFSLDALGPYLHLTYPTLVDQIRSYPPVPLLHQQPSVGAELTIFHAPWPFFTPPIQAAHSIPASVPTAPISASFTLDLWEPPLIIATIDASYETEVA